MSGETKKQKCLIFFIQCIKLRFEQMTETEFYDHDSEIRPLVMI